jgi:hypothetical protein
MRSRTGTLAQGSGLTRGAGGEVWGDAAAGGVGAGEAGTREVGAGEVGAGEAGTREVGAGEVDAGDGAGSTGQGAGDAGSVDAVGVLKRSGDGLCATDGAALVSDINAANAIHAPARERRRGWIIVSPPHA